VTLIEQVFAIAGNALALGAMVTVLDGKVRIKHLPIVR